MSKSNGSYRTEPLRLELLKRGWSQRQLATLAGVSQKTVSDVLRGQNQFPPTVQKIAAALRVPMRDLVRG